MVIVKRTNSEDPNFVSLVAMLDADLLVRDGAEHSFYAQFNKIDKIKYVVVAFQDGAPVGCGAIKEFSAEAVEVKRMYVIPAARKRAVASTILAALESWARELSYHQCVLETGTRQPEAIELYTRNGYQRIDNYGQYAGVTNSLCFAKYL